MVTVLAVGSLVSYIMDSMQQREGAFMCSWAMLIATEAAFSVTLLVNSSAPVWIVIFLVAAMGAVTVLCGMWASLQCGWRAVMW